MSLYCEGDNVYLRNVQVSDINLIVTWKNDPFVQKMALYPDVAVCAEDEMQSIKRALETDNELYVIVVVKETDQPIGYIRVNFWEGQPGCAWLRFALGERGKGYGKDAITCVIEHLFEEGFHRIDAEVYAFNTICLSLLTSLGFVKEGVKREAFFDGEKYTDIVVLGLLRSDFRYRSLKDGGVKRLGGTWKGVTITDEDIKESRKELLKILDSHAAENNKNKRNKK
ncbi:MAG: hypothetical protein AYK18_08410 [Theionarchaea archaeon DG-70]|nr:MAG: hypothetical protein AYK18_08410 [Theionarchaea archaeon DG-70]